MASSLRALTLAFVSLVSITASACASDATDDAAEASDQHLTSGTSFYVSASTVENLGGSLAGVTPAVRTADAAHKPEFYLDDSSALGPLGPLGAWGPLGALGAIGDNTWNPSYYIGALGDWSSWSKKNTDGPLSESGPLGPKGPLSDAAYDALPTINDWSKQLQAGGVWTVLGPLGPLGALGPLGPLGPAGAHGYAHDDDGNYKDKSGRVMRSVDVPYQGSTRTYGLVEKYRERFAKTMTDNDTSFMIEGSIDSSGEQDDFAFTSRDDQFVTVTLVPVNSLSDFDFELIDGTGRTVLKSAEDGRQQLFFGLLTRSGSYIDFAQVKVAPNEKLTARVTAKSTAGLFVAPVGGTSYRLIVTGSTNHFTTTDIHGPHQVAR